MPRPQTAFLANAEEAEDAADSCRSVLACQTLKPRSASLDGLRRSARTNLITESVYRLVVI